MYYSKMDILIASGGNWNGSDYGAGKCGRTQIPNQQNPIGMWRNYDGDMPGLINARESLNLNSPGHIDMFIGPEGLLYVAFGAIYATSTKPEAGNVGIEVIQQARQKFDVPICAIGGLTVENSQGVIEAGASLCAVISDILGRSTAEIPARVSAWAKLFA